MKKYFLLLVFLFSSGIMFGQFGFGLKGGYNASRLSTDVDSVASAYGSGFNLGVYVRIGQKFFVQPEAYYTLQTSKFSGSDGSEERITLGSVDIPVLAGFRFLNSKTVKIRVMAGPLVSFVINRNIKELNDSFSPSGMKEGDISDINWAIQAGAGVDIRFISLDLRYQAGLNNVIKDVRTTTWDSKNNAWVISLGFNLR